MSDKFDYLPLGSVVIVNGSVKKYVIVARGLQLNVNGRKLYFDYGACQYPEGMIGDQLMYFQHSNINKVVFEGYKDDDNQVMVEMIEREFEKQGLSRENVEELKLQLEE